MEDLLKQAITNRDPVYIPEILDEIKQNRDWYTLPYELYQAARYSTAEDIQWLTTQAPELASVDICSENALMYAASQWDITAVGVLLEAGFDPNQLDSRGDNALFHVLTAKPSYWTMKITTLQAKIAIANMLLEAGLDVNTQNNEGKTILRILLDKRRTADVQIISLLLEWGADPDVRATTGDTLLCSAMDFYNGQLMSLLLKYGADTDHVNLDGETALLKAVKYRWQIGSINYLCHVVLLINHGADLTQCDSSCNTFIDLIFRGCTHHSTSLHKAKHELISNITRLDRRAQVEEMWKSAIDELAIISH